MCIQLSSRYPGKHVTIYPDASGQSRHTNASESDIDILRAAGFTVMVNGMNPAIRDRINAVNGLLAHGKMKVNTNTCQHLSISFDSQGYDKKGQPEKFDTHPAIDDWCFSGDTKIIVNGSEIFFRDIPESGFITGYDGKEIRFYNGGLKGHDRILVVKLSSGIMIKVTEDHEFLTLNGWVKASELLGQTLCCTELFQKKYKSLIIKNSISEAMGIFIKHLGKMEKLIEERLEKAYTGMSGSFITEKYRKGLLFTIKMKIREITIFQTLILCLGRRITQCILLSGINNILIIQKKILIKARTSAENGTDRMLGKIGTRITTKTTSIYFIENILEYANIAKRNMSAKIMGKTVFVQGNANHRREEIAGLIMKKDRAKIAEAFLNLINIILKNTARKVVEKKHLNQEFSQNHHKLVLFVPFVARNILDLEKKLETFAHQHVNQRTEKLAELIKKIDIASLAIKYFQRIKESQLNTVVTSVEVLNKKEPVYCLSTNDGCFSLANGVIVSNCDSAGYFISYRYPVAGVGGISRLTGY